MKVDTRASRHRISHLHPTLGMAFFLMFAGCGESPMDAVEGGQKPVPEQPDLTPLNMVLDPFHPTLAIGGSVRLTPCWVSPDGGSIWPVWPPLGFAWSSGDETVASVDEGGLVQTHSSGMATITAVRTVKLGYWGRTAVDTASTPVVVR